MYGLLQSLLALTTCDDSSPHHVLDLHQAVLVVQRQLANILASTGTYADTLSILLTVEHVGPLLRYSVVK